jgi:hypothetical protein
MIERVSQLNRRSVYNHQQQGHSSPGVVAAVHDPLDVPTQPVNSVHRCVKRCLTLRGRLTYGGRLCGLSALLLRGRLGSGVVRWLGWLFLRRRLGSVDDLVRHEVGAVHAARAPGAESRDAAQSKRGFGQECWYHRVVKPASKIAYTSKRE